MSLSRRDIQRYRICNEDSKNQRTIDSFHFDVLILEQLNEQCLADAAKPIDTYKHFRAEVRSCGTEFTCHQKKISKKCRFGTKGQNTHTCYPPFPTVPSSGSLFGASGFLQASLDTHLWFATCNSAVSSSSCETWLYQPNPHKLQIP